MNAVLTALQSGYSPDKILKYLSKIDPDLALKINTAMQAGHSVERILNYVSQMGGKVSKLFENEKQSKSNIYKRAQKSIHPFLKSAGQLGLMAGAGALGTAALSRALPQAAQQLFPEVSTALSKPPAIPSQLPKTVQEALKKTAPEIGKELISKELEQTGGNLPVSAVEKAPQTISKGPPPLPPLLLEKAQNLLKNGNSTEQTAGALQSIYPKQVKEYEKETGKSIGDAVNEFSSQMDSGKQQINEKNNQKNNLAGSSGKGIKESDVTNPDLRETQLNAREKENLSEIGGMAKGITDNFYEGIFKSLSEGKDTFSGVKDPLIAKVKPYFDKKLIKSPGDLKEFANNPEKFEKKEKTFSGLIEEGRKKYEEHQNAKEIPEPTEYIPKKEKGSTVALPSGEIGEITDIRQGIATVNAHGKEYRRKVDDLVEAPMEPKKLAKLYEDLVEGIKNETGHEISRAINYVGFNPEEKSLIVHYTGAGKDTYTFNDLDPKRIQQLMDMQQLRRTTGENYVGGWEEGTKSILGSKVHDLVKELEQERGGKGKAHAFTYKTLYDAMEPAKEAKEEAFRQKQEEKRANKPPKEKSTKERPAKEEKEEPKKSIEKALKMEKEKPFISEEFYQKQLKGWDETVEKLEEANKIKYIPAEKKEVKRPEIEPHQLKKHKSFILDAIEESLKNPSKAKKVEIDVPGDGTFKINNDKGTLEKFFERVDKKWPTGPMSSGEPKPHSYPRLKKTSDEKILSEFRQKSKYTLDEIKNPDPVNDPEGINSIYGETEKGVVSLVSYFHKGNKIVIDLIENYKGNKIESTQAIMESLLKLYDKYPDKEFQVSSLSRDGANFLNKILGTDFKNDFIYLSTQPEKLKYHTIPKDKIKNFLQRSRRILRK